MTFIIYKHTNKITGKSYIGQTNQGLKRRLQKHVSASFNESDNYFHRAIKKYGKDCWESEIIFKTENINLINQAEIFLIDYYDTFKNGYNLTKGGDSLRGYKHSKTTKLKISNSLTGRKQKKSTIEKRRLKLLGKKRTEESKMKYKLAQTGSNSHRFNGYWITPWGEFESSGLALANTNIDISIGSIKRWCKNQKKKINKTIFSHSKYLQQLKESPIGKTYEELGFGFRSI